LGTLYNQIAGRSLERIAALSDGLFAIAMTLIVLDIHVPPHAAIRTEADLAHALAALLPEITTYLMTFMTLGIFWTGQQTQLSNCTSADRHFGWIHLAFLAAVAVMPFTASLLSGFITFRVALLLYWLNILVLGAILYASWHYANRAGLVKPEITQAMNAAIRRRIAVAQALYAIGAALCVINTYWSIGCILAIQVNYAVAPRIRLLARLTA
jgi:uncharacterized membrane protein